MKTLKNGLKTITTKEDAWKACLDLWEYLSKHPMKSVQDYNVKEVALRKLGYDLNYDDCPMCAYSSIRSSKSPHDGKCSCEYCPIYQYNDEGCFRTPYENWDNLNHGNKMGHSIKYAKLFYEYLLKVYAAQHQKKNKTPKRRKP
jgi:hypothetical protein